MQHVPGATRLVARADLAVARDAGDSLLQCREVIRQSLEAGGGLRVLWQDRDRNRVLVHIHAETDD